MNLRMGGAIPYSPFTPSWRDRDNFQESSGNAVNPLALELDI
jgi:hypothetical protein